MRASETLTEREAEVMALVAQGLDRREVARALGVKTGTVKAHIKNIRLKYGMEGGTLIALVLAWERSKEATA